MFKLTNILSSGSNLTEPVHLPIDSQYRYTVGGVAVMKDGRLLPARGKDRPTHLLGESKGPRESGRILAYEITERMIFEVPISTMPTLERIGSRVKIDDTPGTSDTVMHGIGAAMIIDMNGARRKGDTLYVLFPERKES